MVFNVRQHEILRFGLFELDLGAGELRKKGVRVKLQEQPLQVLTVLLRHPGKLVTREELRSAVWPNDTFVDFDNSLNTAVNKLRDALDDSADNPRFVETLPRRGYRFLVPVTRNGGARPERRRARKMVLIAGVASIFAIGAITAYFSLIRSTRGRIHSIAVLPFTIDSGDTDTEYLSDGLTEGLIEKLSGLPEIRVISRTSAFRYKKRAVDPQTVARELDVDALLTGTITQRGSNMLVSAELVDAREDRHLWGGQYTRSLSDTPSFQQEIATAILENLRVQLSGQQKERLMKSPGANPEAYHLYLKGRFYANQNTAEGFEKSVEYFHQAIEKDPAYALAYAALADSYLDRSGGWLYRSPLMDYPKAKAAATKALQLDGALAEAHAALALALFYERKWPAAEHEFKHAIELNPNGADSHQRYAEFLLTRGRIVESLAEARQALELDPLSLETVCEPGTIYLMDRQYDQAIAEFEKALELYPNASAVRSLLAYAYAFKQQYPQALDQVSKIDDRDKAITSENQFIAGFLGDVYAVSGNRADAQKIAQQLTQLSSQGYIDWYGPGSIHAALGNKNEAFRLLEKAYQQNSTELLYLGVDPILDGIRSDERYLDLLRRMGLPSQPLSTDPS